MLNGLDLFSGIGGLSIALSEWVRPMAYCEIDPYCQGVLLNRMAQGELTTSPICDDIRELRGDQICELCDIIYGGFPCQDISVAGNGKGLDGERSGLFWEIVRLSKEIKPTFIFLENVPAITSRGGTTVVRALAEMGYDCRWCVISAASIGALHRRERWFLLAYAKHDGSHGVEKRRSTEEAIPNYQEGKNEAFESKGVHQSRMLATKPFPNSSSMRCDEGSGERVHSEWHAGINEEPPNDSGKILNYWENTEPPVCGIPNGIPNRVDRIRALGNAVVPSQAKEAFKILMGLKKIEL